MSVTIQMPGDGGIPWATSLRLMFMLGAMALIPAVLLVATSFTRIVIVFSFLRTALGGEGGGRDFNSHGACSTVQGC